MKKSKLDIIFFGDGNWALNTIKLLVNRDDINIKKVYLRYPIPDNSLKEFCINNNIEFLIVKDINLEYLVKNNYSDLGISVSYDQIFKEKTIKCHKKGIINCHAGELPDFRGRNILNWVLINNKSHFAITVHYVDNKVDSGDIIFQKKIPINIDDDYGTLLKKSYEICPEVTLKAIDLILENKVKPLKQNLIKSNPIFCTRRIPGDELIDWNWNSQTIFNFIRALVSPGPYAQSLLGESYIYFKKATFLENAPKYIDIPGSILYKDEKGFIVKTGDSYLLINEWECDNLIRVGDRLSNGFNNC